MVQTNHFLLLTKRTLALCAMLLLAACAGTNNQGQATDTLTPDRSVEQTTATLSKTATDDYPGSPRGGSLGGETETIFPEAPATLQPPQVIQADIKEEQHLLLGHLGGVAGPVWSPTGSTLATGDGVGFIRIWDAESGELIRSIGGWELTPVTALAWSPDGGRLASGHSDGQLNLWNVEDGALLVSSQEHQSPITSLSWAPDGLRLASADEAGDFLVWNGQSAQLIERYEGNSRVQSIPDFEWFPGSTAAAWAGERGRAWFWNLEGELISLIPSQLEAGETFTSIAISPDAITLAVGSSTSLIRLWDLNSGVEYDPLDSHTASVLSLDFSPDSSKLVSGGADGRVILWDVAERVGLRVLRDKVNAVLGVAWSPDGRRIAVALDDGTVRIYGE